MSFPTEQTVFRLTGYNGYSGLKSFNEPLSTQLSSDEVLIKIKAVALNYRDTVIAKNQYLAPPKPNVIPCADATGHVVKVGSGVTDFEVGDRVITNFDPENLYGVSQSTDSHSGCIRDGVLRQYMTISKYRVNKLPKDSHLSDEEAASLVASGVTAYNGLFGAGFTPGQTVLMLGTGGVSISALILAKAAGCVTIITSSSDEKLKLARETFGADHTVNYRTHPDWEKEVMDITKGRGVDLVIESSGNGTIAKSIASTRCGGQIAIIGIMTQAKEMPDMLTGILSKSITARGITVGSKQLSEEMIEFIHAKKLHFPIERVFGYTEEEVRAGYASVENQSNIGKNVIRVD